VTSLIWRMGSLSSRRLRRECGRGRFRVPEAECRVCTSPTVPGGGELSVQTQAKQSTATGSGRRTVDARLGRGQAPSLPWNRR
jgi:hypothetical protein